MPVTIGRIEPIAVHLPLAQPLKRATGTTTTADNLLVRVEAGAVVGWGEAAAAPAMTGELLPGMVEAVRFVAPLLEGRSLDDIEGAVACMAQSLYGNPGVKAAIEVALYDALGKVRGQPVHALLGGGRRDSIPVLRYIASGDTDTDIADAARLRADGCVAFKLKVGARQLREDIERTRAVCAVLGKTLTSAEPGRPEVGRAASEVLVCADANQGWTEANAIEYVRAVAATSQLDFLEQPVHGDDLAAMARVAAASPIALGCDEGLRSARDLRDHQAIGAAAGASLKLGKLGGLLAAQRMALLCDSLGMKVNLACKIAEAGVGTAALLHLAAAIPSLQWGVALTSTYLRDDILVQPLEYANGHVQVPRGPGLGVEVDEARVRAFAA
jgi:muconate cycloisomerase